MKAYFDNVATTPIAPEVATSMNNVLTDFYGNPSSSHHFGRIAKTMIEKARTKIGRFLNVAPTEIVFTAGGTEANNLAIVGSVDSLNIKHIISSPIEHKAVLYPLEALAKKGVETHFVDIEPNGAVCAKSLETLLQKFPGSLVSLMHANNEIGTLLSMKDTAGLCHKYDAIFHCDMVQTIGHYEIDLKKLGVDLASCSAHKFHGPQGVGLLYINKEKIRISPILRGGSQESNMRSGTENIPGIIGMKTAFEHAHDNMEAAQNQVTHLKEYLAKELITNVPGISFAANSDKGGLYTILTVVFPEFGIDTEMMLMNLDIRGIAASGGSACSSGSTKISHVAKQLNISPTRAVIRFSFSMFNTKSEVDYCISKIINIMEQVKS